MMKRYMTDIIIVAIFFLLILLLAGCSKSEPVSDTIADNAVNTVVAVEKALPEECKTEAVKTQLTVVKSEIRSITKACDSEKDVITQDKLKWKWSFWGMILLIGLYVARKVMK